MMKHIAVLLAFLMMIGSQVSAFDTADLQRLIDTKKCSRCSLTDTDLYRANLEGANLAGANLKGAVLCNTIMPDGSVIDRGC